jgi:YHS domain-containing protein
MEDVSGLLSRIDQEFTASKEKIEKFRTEQVEAHQGRQARLELFARDCQRLQGVWKPRLEVLARKVGEVVKVTPRIEPSLREATFEFRSNLASIRLRFTVSTDGDVRNLVLDYDLHIIPILMKFERHARLEFPLEAADPQAIGKWIDDRIVDFVRTYLSLGENEYYMKPHMVTDPIAGIEFPKSAAGATLDWKGKTYFFISEETKTEFEKKQAVAMARAAAEAKARAQEEAQARARSGKQGPAPMGGKG